MPDEPPIPAIASRVPLATHEFQYDYLLNARLIEKISKASPALDKLARREAIVSLAFPFAVVFPITFFAVKAASSQAGSNVNQLTFPLIIAAAITLLYSMFSLDRTTWRRFRKQMYQRIDDCHTYARQTRTSPTQAVVDLSSFGVMYCTRDNGAIYPWLAFESLLIEQDAICFVYTDSFDGIIIPAASFASPAHRQAFVHVASDLLSQSKKTAPRATQTTPLCINCNYMLEGLDSSNCPECGRPQFSMHVHARAVLARGWLAMLRESAHVRRFATRPR